MRLAICFFAFFLLGTSGTPIQPVEILSGVWGSFSSPNYPRVYNNNLRKEWTIRVREGHHIMLEFTSFNLEDSYEPDNGGSCVYDYVLVTEGDETRGRFCGKAWYDWDAPTPNKKFFSKGRQVHLVFVSDFSNEDISPTGFEAYYTEIDNDECDEMNYKSKNTDEDWDELVVCDHFCHNFAGSYDCSCRIGYRLHSNQHTCLAIADCVDQELTADEGIIESPDYPNPYAKLSHCAWNIRVRDGFNVHLTFNSEFEVEVHDDKEDHNGCVYDILEISYNDEKETYCGTTAPQNGTVWDMNTTNVKIDFKTDLSVETKGFRIFYNTSRVRCLDSLNDPTNGEIVTSYQKGYYEFEDVVGHRCNRGYDLIGESRLECLSDGNWNNQQPTCRIKSCGSPDNLTSVENSHIVDFEQKQFEYMENITVDCNDWYELTAGSPTWVCEDSKEWVKTSIPRAPNPPHDYPQCAPKCGKRLVAQKATSSQIAGPKLVEEHGGWPWMAFVDRGGGRAGEDYCGGTLVDDKTVITAAHCIQPIDNDDDVVVWLGFLNRISDNFNFTQRFVVPWNKRHVEESYSKNEVSSVESFNGDIAILKLDQPANLSYYVHPICVPNPVKQERLIRAMKTARMNFVVTGWGKNELGAFSEKLMKTRVGYVNHDTCSKSFYQKHRRNDMITENMICAGFVHISNDACQGDSGGPLMTKDAEKTWYLSGVVSFGDLACNGTGSYGVYTDVSKYYNFVAFHLEKNK